MKYPVLTSLATAAILALTATAQANTYDVYSCWAGVDSFRNPNASSAAWTKDESSTGGHYTTGNDCGINSTNGSISIVSVTGDLASRGESAEWRFIAPAGTSLAFAKLWRRAWTYGTGSGGSSQRNFLTVLADGYSLSGDSDGSSDAPWGSRGTGDTTAHGIVDSNLFALNLAPRAPSRVSYRVGCGFDAGCQTGSLSGPPPNYFASGVEIFGAQVSVSDSTLPSLTVADSGLFAAGNMSGIRPVLVQSASDVSGIKKLAVFADGAATPIGVLDFEQDVNWCNWSAAAPCQNVTDTEIPVDTTQLTDGEHALVVKAYDAADNEKASTTRYVTVKNASTTTTPTDTSTTPTDPAAGSPSGTGLPNGTDPSTDSGMVDANATPKLTVQFDQNGQSKLSAKYARMITVRGHLTDGRGGPIVDAQVAYSALSTRAGARLQSLGAVRTDSSGSFTLSVATKLGSRQLRFGYSPHLGGPTEATAQAELDVAAPVSFRLNRKHVRNGQSVVFTGRLGAGPIPRKGKLVSLQVVVDGRWHTFAVVRSTKRGGFKYRYRFKRTYGRVTYRFRALSRYEAAYPFVAGHSRTARLRVN